MVTGLMEIRSLSGRKFLGSSIQRSFAASALANCGVPQCETNYVRTPEVEQSRVANNRFSLANLVCRLEILNELGEESGRC